MRPTNTTSKFFVLLAISLAVSAASPAQVKPAPTAAQRNAAETAAAPQVQPSTHVYIRFVDARNQAFKGEAAAQGSFSAVAGWSPVLSFQYEAASPKDAATGMASGKRQHEPVKIIKEWGASSPQLFEAATKGETLADVTVAGIARGKDGKDEPRFAIHMKHARITSLKALPGPGGAKREELTIECAAEDFHGYSGEGKPIELHQVPLYDATAH